MKRTSEVVETLREEAESALDLQRDGDIWVLTQWSKRGTSGFFLRFDDSPTRNWLGGYTESRGVKSTTWTIKYEPHDGISIPTEFHQEERSSGGLLRISRHFRMVSSQLNVPVSESDFNYKALGVGNGTRMVDRATGKTTVLLDDQWLSVADYNLACLKRREERSWATLARILAAYGVAALGIGAVVYWRLRRRRK